MDEHHPADIASAVHLNLYALFRAMAAALPGGELQENGRFSRHHTVPTNPMFKGVWATQLSPDEVTAAVDDSIAWFKARRAPYFFWWTDSATMPDDLGVRLQARGLIDMAAQMETLAAGIRQTALGAPGMVADLLHVDEGVLTRVPPDFHIAEVQDAAGLQAFKQVFVDAYEIPAWAGQAWVDATQTIGIGAAPWRMFVGYLRNQPVATNMLFVGARVAALYAVATLPAARGQGIGAAISLQPLLLARAQGLRHAVLFSTEMGVRVYERIGFRQTGTRINRYLWRNEDV